MEPTASKSVKISILLLLLCIIVITFRPPEARSSQKILVLHSYHKGLGWTDKITEGIESTLIPALPGIDIVYEFMDTKRVFDDEHLENVYQLLHHKYRSVSFSVIISSDDHAFRFLLKYGESLFGNTPLVFCGVNLFEDSLIQGRSQITGVVESFSIKDTLDAILKIHPAVRTIYAVLDSTVTGNANKKLLEASAQAYAYQLDFVYLENLTMRGLQEEVANLPDTGVILWLSFTSDAEGNTFSLEQSTDLVTRASRRPVYSFWDFSLGHGIVGGKITSGIAQGKTAAELALKIIQGESPQALPVIKQSPNRYIFDYSVMSRFGIKESDLPPDSEIIKRPMSFYQQNKKLVWQVLFIMFLLAGVAVFSMVNLLKRRVVEQALRSSEEQYRLLVENANDAIFIAQEGKMAFFNRRTQEILKYSPEEIRSMPFISFVHPDYHDLVKKNYISRLQGDLSVPATYSITALTKDQEEITIQLSAVRIEWQGKPATLNFARDITEQTKMQASLNQAQKLEALGTLAGGIAHDFNNLLMAIQGRTSLIRTQVEHTHPAQEHLGAIEEHIESASSLTRQLLGSARGGKYNPQATDLGKMLAKCAEMFGRTRKDIQIVTKLSEGGSVSVVDKQQIEQVFWNMFVNSSHAMPGGGQLYLKTARETFVEASNPHHHIPAGNYNKIVISDTGTGMDEITRQRIFDPFFTTKDKTRGTGLGLASAYGIIKNHSGFITVDSELGKGTTFNIYLPISDQKPTESIVSTMQLERGNEAILLVDDEQIIQEVGQALLAELGYTATVAGSAQEALKIIKSAGESFSLVILDLIMPEMDGAALFAEIRKITPTLPVIMSSGYAADEQTEELLARGCNAFLQKPFTLQALSNVIRRVLDEA